MKKEFLPAKFEDDNVSFRDFIKSRIFKRLFLPLSIFAVLFVLILFWSDPFIMVLYVASLVFWSSALYFLIKDISSYVTEKDKNRIRELEGQLKRKKFNLVKKRKNNVKN